MSFFNKKWKGTGVVWLSMLWHALYCVFRNANHFGLRQGISSAGSNLSPKNKKEEPTPELTPLEKLLQNAGPIRDDGRDKFFGLENV